VAHFTDTFYEVNGVALTLQQQVRIAKKMGKRYTVLTCDQSNRTNVGEVKNFQPVGVSELPVYQEQKLYYPPFLEMLDYCYENNFTHIHSSAPGPIGLAALIIARILKLPINATYHTSLPQYAQYLTGDNTIEDLMWKYVLWYYNQMDLIFVPSMSTGKELEQRGIHPNKMRVFPRGIDVERFHPSNRSRAIEEKYSLGRHPRLLYVGRVSKEKNLELLADVFKSQIKNIPDASLTIVGDGPYLEEMKDALKGTPTVFTGYLEGDDLAGIYASCDLFVFPSTTDTFGNVVLEAQASGLPVIVTDSGGPQENLIPGKTGLVVQANNAEDFCDAVKSLLTNADHLRDMGKMARQYMEERAFDKAFDKTWQIYEEQLANAHTAMAKAV
jgi:glycosyltransferase involved in cell wall biosynthesis